MYAGLEIELDEGWKTYWRHPGSSGVPPRIDFGGSENLAAAELLFPAPIRFKDHDGDIIGYKKHVILPVALTPIDPSKPIDLKFAAEFGICRDICIPVQPMLALTVPPAAGQLPGDTRLDSALARVPQVASRDVAAPRIERVSTELSSDQPRVVLDVHFPGDAAHGDVFLEAPDGLWIPLPQPNGEGANGSRRFVVDLKDGADIGDLKGRSIRATLVGSASQSETKFDLVEAN